MGDGRKDEKAVGTPLLRTTFAVATLLCVTACGNGAGGTTDDTGGPPLPSGSPLDGEATSTPAGSPANTPALTPAPTLFASPTPAPGSPAATPTPPGSPADTPDVTPFPTREPASPTPAPGSPTAAPPPPEEVYCPENMQGITTSQGDLLVCVDAYEVTVSGELGSHDQLCDGAIPTEATTASVAGVEPTILISYDQAVAACAQTPMLDREGNLVGYKHLITSDTWRDACDGVVGDGGTMFPYGNVFDEDACATLDANGQQTVDGPVPTGSYPACVSAFGVYDLTGNVWEWADTGMRMDIDAWFDLATASGMGMYADDDDLLATYLRHDITVLYIQLVGLQPEDLYIDSDGYLKLPADRIDYMTDEFGHGPRGYLMQVHGDYQDATSCAECFLPVEVVPLDLADDTQPFLLAVSRESDGAPVADKRGGSFYSVEEPTCMTSQLVHFHDTHGTIGFRCACDPISDRSHVQARTRAGSRDRARR